MAGRVSEPGFIWTNEKLNNKHKVHGEKKWEWAGNEHSSTPLMVISFFVHSYVCLCVCVPFFSSATLGRCKFIYLFGCVRRRPPKIANCFFRDYIIKMKFNSAFFFLVPPSARAHLVHFIICIYTLYRYSQAMRAKWMNRCESVKLHEPISSDWRYSVRVCPPIKCMIIFMREIAASSSGPQALGSCSCNCPYTYRFIIRIQLLCTFNLAINPNTGAWWRSSRKLLAYSMRRILFASRKNPITILFHGD